MPAYGQNSTNKLAQAHPDLRVIFNWVIKHYDHLIADSYRTKAKQEEYFNKGLSKVHYPTVHNTKPANAVDAYVYELGHADYDIVQAKHFAGFVKAAALMLLEQGKITHRIRNGGDWDMDNDVNDNPFEDPGHFEIIPNPGETFQYFET